jgi:uncharacterized protein (TIGR00255 family)
MIKSMTGYGISQTELDPETNLICVIKTVNHKFLDISISLYRDVKLFEPEIMKRLKKEFTRGRIETSFYRETNTLKEDFDIDFEKAQYYFDLLQKLKDHLSIQGEIDISLLSNFSDIFTKKSQTKIDNDTLSEMVTKLLDSSIKKVKSMRAEEGSSLYADFKERLTHAKKELSRIQEEADNNLNLWRERIRQNIDSVKTGIKIDETRVEQEILLYALRSDITEECTRLESHISRFESLLDSDEPVGKQLLFLLQEMNREISTLFVKTQSITVQNCSATLKDEIEHLKEQVYNIE